MKTIKYMINSYLSDGIVSTSVEVSKTKFSHLLKEIIKQYDSQIKDSEFYVEMDNSIECYPTFIRKITSFTYGISYIDFVVLECKEGYYFKK